MMQATYPVYISEQSPTQIRGFLTTSYMLYVMPCLVHDSFLISQLVHHSPDLRASSSSTDGSGRRVQLPHPDSHAVGYACWHAHHHLLPPRESM